MLLRQSRSKEVPRGIFHLLGPEQTGIKKGEQSLHTSTPPLFTTPGHHKYKTFICMPDKTFKTQVDDYFVTKYAQLESTTDKIIKKYSRTMEAANVLSAAYLYVIDKEPEILHFSRTFSKSIDHVIYSFALKFINNQLIWPSSPLIDEANKFIKKHHNLDDDAVESLEYQKTTSYQHNIYTEEFIQEFHNSLNKLDGICFQAFYFEGVDNAKDLASKFDISQSSAYSIINRLKNQLKKHIEKNKVE